MFPGSVLALDDRDTISNRTRRHCVLRVDGVPRCRPAVQVAVCDASGRSVLAVGGVVSNSVIRYGDFPKFVFSFVGGVVILCSGPSLPLQLRLFAVYPSISDAINCGRAGRRSAEIHLPPMGVHERGATPFPRTGAVMLGVS